MIVNKMGSTDEDYPDYAYEPIFMLGNAMYVPHYDKKHQWVSYGGEVKTTVELMTLGAKPDVKHLWKRHWTEKEIFKGRERKCSSEILKNMLMSQHVSTEPPARGKKK
jgi:hypothetical protein